MTRNTWEAACACGCGQTFRTNRSPKEVRGWQFAECYRRARAEAIQAMSAEDRAELFHRDRDGDDV